MKPLASAALALVACLVPTLALPQATGATAGATATGANDSLQRCGRPIGVLRIEEDTRADWYRHYVSRLGSTAPLLNMIIMQSNCFVVVERGTGERSISDETRRARGDEARESETRGKGQQVVADYLLKPEIVMANKNKEGANVGGIGRLLPGALGGALGGLAAGMKSSEVATVLTLVDIRSTVRLAAAEGYSKDTSFNIAGFGVGQSGLAAGSAYSNTDEGKLVSAAFFDAYNKLVVALRQYKAQTVEGGMGEGGQLGVQGGTTRASKAVKP
jgi:curli biogenesis system outer membrane secretion channel CsgG